MSIFSKSSFAPTRAGSHAALATADLAHKREAITRYLFPAFAVPPARPDLCVILGSGNCGYRVDAALRLRFKPGTRYLVSGGALMNNGLTEAAFMAKRLRAGGIPLPYIDVEASSRCTIDNLVHIKPLLETGFVGKSSVTMVLVTAGFHMRRTLLLAQRLFAGLPWLQIYPVPAHGPHTAPDNWHQSAIGRRIISDELDKLGQMKPLPDGPEITPI